MVRFYGQLMNERWLLGKQIRPWKNTLSFFKLVSYEDVTFFRGVECLKILCIVDLFCTIYVSYKLKIWFKKKNLC